MKQAQQLLDAADVTTLIGVERLEPHDLRRTFAKLARKGGAGLEQLQAALGHTSISTTECYLGEMQDSPRFLVSGWVCS